jgi:hypothetical protein
MLTFSHTGSRAQKGTQSRIPDPDPQHWYRLAPQFERLDVYMKTAEIVLCMKRSETMLYAVIRINEILVYIRIRRAVLRIRNKSLGSYFGSGSAMKLVFYPDPVSDPL